MFGQLFLLGTIIVFYTGCSSKGETRMEKSFEKTIGSGALMQKTEKIKIGQDNEVKISLAVTYLNDEESILDEENKVREKFIVNLYQADDVNGVGLINADQSLILNIQYPESDEEFTKAEIAIREKGVDKLPLKVQKLSPSDPMLKNIPMVNNWNSYYYVEFPHTRRKKFTLVYQNKVYGIKSAIGETQEYEKYKLNFTKREKYLYQKSKKLF